MQREWSIIDDATGVTLASVTADTGMGGAALTFYGTWHTPALLERYGAVLQDVATWLRTNETAG